jgi:hypothetical protein
LSFAFGFPSVVSDVGSSWLSRLGKNRVARRKGLTRSETVSMRVDRFDDIKVLNVKKASTKQIT